MRKKLDTRFPAPRIKKIMQADEDVGKIALAVPVLVSKALELFLQDLCDRTYGITVQRGVKTVSSAHLRQCIHSYNVYDFLRDVVSKVPDIGGADSGADDRHGKKRKSVEEEENEEEYKRVRNEAIGHTNSSRGRGRGRGRGRRPGRSAERETNHYDKFEDDSDMKLEPMEDGSRAVGETKEAAVSAADLGASARNFDLNLGLSDSREPAAAGAEDHPAPAARTPAPEPTYEMKIEDLPSWPLAEMGRVAIDPVQFALSHQRVDEEEEDYDEEG